MRQAAKGDELIDVGRQVVKHGDKMENHHLLPRQFRGQFDNAGLKVDDEQFIIKLSRSDHRLQPNGLHTGPNNWNKRWDDFFKRHRDKPPTREQIEAFLEGLKKEYGLL